MNELINSYWPLLKKYQKSIANGVTIGFFVGFSVVIYNSLNEFISSNLKSQFQNYLFILPLVGMMITGLIVKFFKIEKTSMADDVVFAYHTDANNIELQKSVPKLFGSISTASFGASAGLEGSSKWLGAVIGYSLHRFKVLFLKREDTKEKQTKALMIGAAAGIAAIFRAPLSGTIMALESPYKKDLAHEPLVEAFIAAVTSYTIFSTIVTSKKFFLINLNYTLQIKDIFICALIGLIAGISSIIFLNSLNLIKTKITSKISLFLKYLIGGVSLSALVYLSMHWFNSPVTMYSGLDLINEIIAGKFTGLQLIFISILKAFATIITFAFGGLGGLFLPSAAIGAAIGELCQYVFHFATPDVLPFVGIAAFIAASYNGLLFGPILIAEISGEPSLVVLGIIASTIAFMVSNGVSNSSHQKEHR